jgi:plastocyanin
MNKIILAIALTVCALPVRGERAAVTHVVRMVGDTKSFRFEPATINAHAGDMVRFVNVSGGPHNVTFSADDIPAGAAETLQKNMGKTIATLSSAMLTERNEVYTISLAGLPARTYKYYCLPHQAMNMIGRIIVR